MPQALQEKPEYTPILGLFLECFSMLNATRLSNQRLTLTEIEKCAVVVGEDHDLLTFTRLMLKLDEAYVTEVRKTTDTKDLES